MIRAPPLWRTVAFLPFNFQTVFVTSLAENGTSSNISFPVMVGYFVLIRLCPGKGYSATHGFITDRTVLWHLLRPFLFLVTASAVCYIPYSLDITPPWIISLNLMQTYIYLQFTPPSAIHGNFNSKGGTLRLRRTREMLELTVPPYVESSYLLASDTPTSDWLRGDRLVAS